MKNNLFIIAKSGWKYIFYTLLAATFFWLFDLEFLASLSLFAALFSAFVFRNPEREYMQSQESLITAPVDGVVSKIESLKDSDFAYKIEIEASYMNVAVLRAPMDAEVVSLELLHGSRLSKKSKLFPLLNEYANLSFVDSANHKVVVEQRVKQSFAPIELDIKEKDRVIQGGRYGVALCAVTTIFLESDLDIKIQEGATVTAAETALATFH